MKKICKYDKNHWLFQDENKNLILFNEQTQMLHDLQSFIHPERSNREDLIECVLCKKSHDNQLFLGTAQDNTNDMISKKRDKYYGMKKYPDDLILKSIELKRSGKTYKEIAKELEIPLSTISSFFRKRNDVSDFYNVPKYPEEIRRKAFELRNSGMMCKDIQKILNIPKRTLTRILNKEENKILESNLL